jgi:hypothetical protein
MWPLISLCTLMPQSRLPGRKARFAIFVPYGMICILFNGLCVGYVTQICAGVKVIDSGASAT